jgi:hypothetical protein
MVSTEVRMDAFGQVTVNNVRRSNVVLPNSWQR